MASHTTRNGKTYSSFTDITPWTPTIVSQINDVGENTAFARDVAVHGLSGDNLVDGTAAFKSDGFAIFDCVNYDILGATNKVTLITMKNYGGTNIGSATSNGLRYRTCHITGTIFWSATPRESQPRYTSQTEHMYVKAREDDGGISVSGRCDLVDAFFFTGPGAAAFDSTTPSQVAKIESYPGGTGDKDLFFWVDDTTENFMFYWNGESNKGISYMFHVTFGPRFRAG